jgi:N-methylhydantoinase B
VSLDPVTLAVLQGRLEQIADEMDATLFRAAFNPIIAEAHDASHGLYDAVTGDTLVQGKQGLPVFVGAMAFAVRAVIDRHTRAGTSPVDGDVHIFNDPYDGGTHLSDFKLVRPYFREGRLFCWLASVGHWHDVGGAVPGNYNPAATECFQEGMLIPPVKLVDAGRFNGDILAILQANSRLPGSLYGDLQGQLGALDLGVARLDALLDQYGLDTLRTAFTALRERAALLMRDCIADLPDGVETVEDYLDNDGITDARLTVRLTVKVVGDELTLDFTGSSPACAGPVNIARSTAIAACYVALKHLFPDVPANAGVLDPVRIIVPEGSFLAVTAPKPVGGYTETILRVIDAVFVALSRFAPTRATACAYGTINALSLSGHRADGQRWVMFSFFGGGHGGHPMGDGLNHGNAPISMATIPPLEILEAAYPVMTTAWALRPDSGGAGQHRGGLGAIYEFELLADQADLFLFGERARVQPPGVLGGEPGAANRFHWTSDGVGHEPALGAKVVGAKLKRGDRVRLATPGGGGFGPAETRDPAATLKDLALGYVTEAV